MSSRDDYGEEEDLDSRDDSRYDRRRRGAGAGDGDDDDCPRDDCPRDDCPRDGVESSREEGRVDDEDDDNVPRKYFRDTRFGTQRVCVRGRGVDKWAAPHYVAFLGQFGRIQEVDQYRGTVFVMFETVRAAEEAVRFKMFTINTDRFYISFANYKFYQDIVRSGERVAATPTPSPAPTSFRAAQPPVAQPHAPRPPVTQPHAAHHAGRPPSVAQPAAQPLVPGPPAVHSAHPAHPAQPYVVHPHSVQPHTVPHVAAYPSVAYSAPPPSMVHSFVPSPPSGTVDAPAPADPTQRPAYAYQQHTAGLPTATVPAGGVVTVGGVVTAGVPAVVGHAHPGHPHTVYAHSRPAHQAPSTSRYTASFTDDRRGGDYRTDRHTDRRNDHRTDYRTERRSDFADRKRRR